MRRVCRCWSLLGSVASAITSSARVTPPTLAPSRWPYCATKVAPPRGPRVLTTMCEPSTRATVPVVRRASREAFAVRLDGHPIAGGQGGQLLGGQSLRHGPPLPPITPAVPRGRVDVRVDPPGKKPWQTGGKPPDRPDSFIHCGAEGATSAPRPGPV